MYGTLVKGAKKVAKGLLHSPLGRGTGLAALAHRLATRLRPPPPPAEPPLQPLATATRVWLDVGAHLGEKTFEHARADPGLRVYAFEPILRLAVQRMGLLANFVVIPAGIGEQDGVADFHINHFDAASSLLPFHTPGLDNWIGGSDLAVAETIRVPTLRLDTFLALAGIEKVEFLKIDAQGADLAVVRSLGDRLADVERISLEVQVTPVPLYEGAASRAEVLHYLTEKGFAIVEREYQSHGQEENLTFVRARRAA